MSKITETTKEKTRESTYMIGDVVVKKNINKMKKIQTVQDLINRLSQVEDKNSPIEVFVTQDSIDGMIYDTNLYDFSVIEDTNTVKIEIYR